MKLSEIRKFFNVADEIPDVISLGVEGGRADMERHGMYHSHPDQHSSPHDHLIDWRKGYPDSQSPINYWDGAIPEFKGFSKIKEGIKNMKYKGQPINHDYNLDDYKFDGVKQRDLILIVEIIERLCS